MSSMKVIFQGNEWKRASGILLTSVLSVNPCGGPDSQRGIATGTNLGLVIAREADSSP